MAGNLTDYIPVTTGTDKATGQEVWVSQYEGSYIEEVGMLKMDFLGLRTLSIIKECLADIKQARGKDIDIEKIPKTTPPCTNSTAAVTPRACSSSNPKV